jgi:hypothetical protein
MSGMHLLPVYWTTNSTKTKKKKKKINRDKYEIAWRKHNKFLKSVRCDTITLDEYIDYCFGKVKKNKPSPSKSLVSEKPYRRETPNHPSLSNNIGGIAPRKEVPVYTGNAVIGQAYNKGGLQVLSAEEAKDPTTGKRR